MSDILIDVLAANRAAVTKLIPRARRLAHVVVYSKQARDRQLRSFAEALYVAQQAERAGAIAWHWLDDDQPVDFGDCEPMAENTYSHEWLHLARIDRGEEGTIDTLGGIIIAHERDALTREQFEDQMAVENYRAIAQAWLAHEAGLLSGE